MQFEDVLYEAADGVGWSTTGWARNHRRVTPR